MSRYFTNFPITEYQGKEIRDITKRSKIRENLLFDPYIYLPYTIVDGEKPETIALAYYGSVDDTWLVLLANNMTDPYYDWPLSDEEFDQYFTDKYSSFSGRTGFDVIRWGQSTTRKDNIVYYYKFIDKSTQQTTPVEPQTDFLTVTNNQLSILLSNGTVTVDGIQYSLEAE